ncbi:MAG: peptide deformylase [Candidatus Latescibacterota bacterium]|nr:MAG: peptide deformylase [Candidatus Latescibacterota bacterium]
MAIRPVRTYGDPVLRLKAAAVEEPLELLKGLVDDMFETMFDEPGIGLAAPQVGVSKRLVVIAPVADDDEGENIGARLVLVNPEITWFSEERVPYEEGCLSVPEITEVVERPRAIQFAYTDLDGVRREHDAAGLLARVVQHELDHLDGVLFVDRLSLIKKQLLRKRLKQLADAARS